MRGKRIEANWQAIRDSVVAGMTYREVSERFNVPSACIRKRASREKWPTPMAIQETIEECKAKQQALIKGDAQSWQNNAEQCTSDGRSTPVSQVSQAVVSQLATDSTADIIGQNWFEKGEVHRRLAFEIATKAPQLIENGRVGLPALEQWF